MKADNTLYFCTLFDKNFITRGLSMYQSLAKTCTKFHLYIFCFDDTTHEVLSRVNLENVTLITLSEFEDEELLKAKSTRSRKEYCWTCTPSTILFCLKKNIPHCIYIDADLYFWNLPQLIIDEIPDSKSVLITEHNYSKEHDQTEYSGRFCVQFMYFKNTTDGLEVANWWRNACNEWCYARFEDGKFGDQKYLDSWPDKFAQVYIMENEGAGIAPWNVQKYSFTYENSVLTATHEQSKKKWPVIFYHFHFLRNGKTNNYFISPQRYSLSKTAMDIIYKEYILTLQKVHLSLNSLKLDFNPHGICSDFHVRNFWDYLRVCLSEIARGMMHLNFKKMISTIKHRLNEFYILKIN